MIRLTIPDLHEEELEAVRQVLATGMLVQGERVAAFEAAVGARLGVAHAVACSSGTAALHLALLALGIGPGDEVIVPAFTFPAAGNVVAVCGATPVLADVRPDTWAIDADAVAARISSRTRAILPVHPFGLAADIDPLAGLAAACGARIVEDAACALGATYRGRPCGALGDLGCFSFHPRKVITTAEGGLVAAQDADLADRVRALRNHGLRRRGDRLDETAAGLNYRMSEVHAAIGLVQLTRLDAILEDRRRVARLYRAALAGLPWLTLPAEPPDRVPTYQSFVVVVAAEKGRDALLARLREKGIECTIGAYALHLLDVYARLGGYRPDDFPVARGLDERALALPIYRGMPEDAVAQIAEALHDA